jgi:hypothetical protein
LQLCRGPRAKAGAFAYAGGTNSEGQVKYCRCAFSWTCHAGSRGSASRVQCRVARCDIGSPAHTSHPLSRLFACFAGPFLGQSGVVTKTQFLDRSSCPLRPSVGIPLVFGCSYAADRGQRLEPSLTLARSIVSRSFLIAIHRLAMRAALRTRITC